LLGKKGLSIVLAVKRGRKNTEKYGLKIEGKGAKRRVISTNQKINFNFRIKIQ
jgi:hypothetical protein